MVAAPPLPGARKKNRRKRRSREAGNEADGKHDTNYPANEDISPGVKRKRVLSNKQQQQQQHGSWQKSHKAQKVNKQLKHSLHELTHAPASGLQVQEQHRTLTGSKNKNIWCPDLRNPDSSLASASKTNNRSNSRSALCSPATEDARARAAHKLRKLLDRQCRQHCQAPPPLLAWERWQAACKLFECTADVDTSIVPLASSQESKRKHGSKSGNKRGAVASSRHEYLLPDDPCHVELTLVNDLVRGGMQEAAARDTALQLAKNSHDLVGILLLPTVSIDTFLITL